MIFDVRTISTLEKNKVSFGRDYKRGTDKEFWGK